MIKQPIGKIEIHFDPVEMADKLALSVLILQERMR